MIAIDYRGIGNSKPTLGCPIDKNGNYQPRECIARLERNGADLAGYTTRSIAADVHDVRQALDLPALNLWGLSYGSRVALTLARDFPQDVRTLLLDGPDPLQRRKTADAFIADDAAVKQLIRNCETDAACGAAFPHLRMRFEAGIRQANAKPLTVGGSAVSGDVLAYDFFVSQSYQSALPLLPGLMAKVADRSLTTLAPLVSATIDTAAEAIAMQLLVTCSDDIDGADQPAIRKLLGRSPLRSALVRQDDFSILRTCKPWPYVRLKLSDRKPLVSRTPTLIFNSQYDPVTSIFVARQAAATLARSRIVTFPGFSHVTLRNESLACPINVAHQFFDAGDIKKIDVSCTNALPQPLWNSSAAVSVGAGSGMSVATRR